MFVLCIGPSAIAGFSTRQYGDVRLSAQENDWRFGEEAVRIIQFALPELILKTGFSEHIFVDVVIAPSESEFRRITGGQIPDWGIAAANPAAGIIFLKSPRYSNESNRIKSIVVHELSHVVLGNVVKRTILPRWFDEGFAMFNSGELQWESNILLARSLITRQSIPLQEIDHVFEFRKDKAALAYRESLAAIEYLTERYGVEILARLILAMAEGESIETAIRLKTGLSMGQFESGWMGYLREKYLWYAVLDTPVILSFSFIILFILAILKTRYQSSRKMARWKSEESEDATVHDSQVKF